MRSHRSWSTSVSSRLLIGLAGLLFTAPAWPQLAPEDMFLWGSQYHPHEHVLQMTRDDLLALPAAVRSFNGLYTVRGQFVMMNSLRVLAVEAVVVLSFLAALVALLVRFIRRRYLARQPRATAAG